MYWHLPQSVVEERARLGELLPHHGDRATRDALALPDIDRVPAVSELADHMPFPPVESLQPLLVVDAQRRFVRRRRRFTISVGVDQERIGVVFLVERDRLNAEIFL